MQGQADPKSNASTDGRSYAGIDVCQSWLDAHVLPHGSTLRVANTGEGIRKLKRWLKAASIDLVAVEATGKWHRAIARSLVASAIRVAVTDPYRVRCFAKAIGLAAKTDRLDARALALYASLVRPDVRELPPKNMENLRELVVAREQARAAATSLKNQRHAATDAFLLDEIEAEIARAVNYAERLDAEILKRIRADDGLKRRFEILTSISGVGDITAITLIAFLGELGSCNAKQIGSLAGLAPRADESGQFVGRRQIGGGRAIVRRALYLAALTASRLVPQFKSIAERLKAAGKSPKVALVAVARKLAVLLNRLVAEDRIWSPEAPKTA